ncbi:MULTISPECIES: hypothetical protein [Anaerolinea]|uniref:Uncharacterized protein n=1 Tax=Anaerolinea thermophila (strain DSM 14523 / JCM 11388 / NBRC 100420 / UNI-1) TaxID=926569 RepID=E8MXW0_ANATU|nr:MULTISPECIES: hypothetical protein [Anaerolinea]BAJ64191.1 hypothetical protein ANT_21650 [Anaerolinea thermophila UNI-1]GAP07491.1 hypothetical protein ATHL_02374 [Anaerolinea thermolimosa]
MSFAFRRHDYNLNEFDRCEKHGCPLMQVTAQAQPVCLMEWLALKAGERTVRDILPKDEGEYDLPALILDNGFMLPVVRAYPLAQKKRRVPPYLLPFLGGGNTAAVTDRFVGWWVSDLYHTRGETPLREAVMAMIRPPWKRGTTREDADNDRDAVLLHLALDILLYLLEDEEIRRYEP